MTCSREDSAGGRGAVPHPVSPGSASSTTTRATEDVVAMSAFQESTRPLMRDHVLSDDNWPIEAHEKEASRSRSGRMDRPRRRPWSGPDNYLCLFSMYEIPPVLPSSREISK